MIKRPAVIAAVCLMLSASAGVVLAHDGHKHTVMGTVMALNARVIEVKTPSGEILSIAINQKTTAIRQKKKIALAEVRVGGRVVVDIGNGDDPLIAKEIELGAAVPAAKK
jgi:hypothetical protein